MASPPFELTIDGVADPLRAHSLRGKEAISRLWSFDVVASGALAEEIERVGLGQRATLILRPGGGSERAFYGVVSAVQLDEVHPSDRETKYVISIVPRLWLLRRKKQSRVFQAMRVPEIVSAVLQEAGIATRWALIRGYPVREYCTQYEETDYEFVRRILAEAGIYYYFYGGGRVDSAALAANAAIAGAAAAGVDVAASAGLGGAAPLLDAAALAAATLVPGDSVVGADDPIAYPTVGRDDAAALSAATAATFAAFALTEAAGGSAIGSAVVDGASAIGSAIVSSLPPGGGADMHYIPNESSFGTAYDRVGRFALRNTVRSTGAVFRDYDPDRPNVRMQSSVVSTAPFPPSPFEIAASPLPRPQMP